MGAVSGDGDGYGADRDVDSDEDYGDGEHCVLNGKLVPCIVIHDLGVIIYVVAMLAFVFTLALLISLLCNPSLVLFSKNYVNICSQYSRAPPPILF